MEAFYEVCAAVAFGVFGLLIGNFLNKVSDHLPKGENLFKPAVCPNCGRRFKMGDKIPLVSYLLLRGKCKTCGAPIGRRHFFVELSNFLLYLAVYAIFYRTNPFYAVVGAVSVSLMICIGVCDAENLFIPDSLQILLAIMGILSIFCDRSAGWQEHLIGLALGGGFYLLFYLASFLIFRREGLGFGDVKLMAAMGLLLGWKKIAAVILLGTLLALVFMVAFWRREKEGSKDFVQESDIALGSAPEDRSNSAKEYPLAFALAVAGILILLAGDRILAMYFSLFF